MRRMAMVILILVMATTLGAQRRRAAGPTPPQPAPPPAGQPLPGLTAAQRAAFDDGLADFREDLQVMVARLGDRRPRRELAHRHPAHDVAEHERLADEPRRGAAEHGGDEDQGEVAEEDGIGRHGARRIPRLRPAREPRPSPRGSTGRASPSEKHFTLGLALCESGRRIMATAIRAMDW